MATPITKQRMYKVRLRGEELPLPVSVDGEGRTHKAYLKPNVWTEVSEPIYLMLKHKFSLGKTRLVPDYNKNEANPHTKTADAAMREESMPGYIIEFKD